MWTVTETSLSPGETGDDASAANASAAGAKLRCANPPDDSEIVRALPSVTPARSASCCALARASSTASVRASSAYCSGSSTRKEMPPTRIASPPAVTAWSRMSESRSMSRTFTSMWLLTV